MSFFKNIFGGAEEPTKQQPAFWHNISGEEDFQAALAESYYQKIVIFKHSTRCQISKIVLKKFEGEAPLAGDSVKFYFLDLLAHRDISNKIASTLGVTHQSPQLIVVKDGKAVADASHQDISIRII